FYALLNNTGHKEENTPDSKFAYPQIAFTVSSVVKLVPSQLFAIAFEVSLHLAQTIAAKLFAHGVSQHQRDHRFANHAGRGHDRNVRPFKSSALFLFGVDIDGAQGATQRRDWLQMSAHSQLFAIGDAALQS